MTKRNFKKELINNFGATKSKDKSYDFDIMVNDKKYALKVLKIGPGSQLTINSPKIWEVASGKLYGIRFIKRNSTLLDLSSFVKNENKIVYLLGNPFRTLQYLNEADVIDITNKKSVHNIHIFNSLEDIKKM